MLLLLFFFDLYPTSYPDIHRGSSLVIIYVSPLSFLAKNLPTIGDFSYPDSHRGSSFCILIFSPGRIYTVTKFLWILINYPDNHRGSDESTLKQFPSLSLTVIAPLLTTVNSPLKYLGSSKSISIQDPSCSVTATLLRLPLGRSLQLCLSSPDKYRGSVVETFKQLLFLSLTVTVPILAPTISPLLYFGSSILTLQVSPVEFLPIT
jgi:hypothetical protein